MSRYDRRGLINNDLERYKNLFVSRGIKEATIYRTPTLNHPDEDEIQNLILIPYRWRTGDKFFKLAHEFYGDAKLWWVIAWFNQAPTESHISLGDLVYVPTPIEQVLTY